MGVASVMQLIVDWHDYFFYACGLCVMWVFEHAIADLFKREIDRKTFIICLPLFIYRLTLKKSLHPYAYIKPLEGSAHRYSWCDELYKIFDSI